ncbi:spore germination protein Q [Croceifilum oryzae]|uniref:Spore germination protein Q n=1 Tax=Croceifilum oryzae TaxID=1553429 RepID=A0AAJ1TEZ8_9BACL|nr:spore coat protein GerQ [Croceifilum oryzae]MDQ0417663.1 spore germination protein Q [Croceifilum oryzae]
MYWQYPYQQYQYGGNVSQAGNIQQRVERYYSEDLLQKNIGKTVTVYLTFENNKQWNARQVTGKLREVGRDFILVKDRQTGKDQMYLNINVDYIVFDDAPATIADGYEQD